MTAITILELPPGMTQRLRLRAASHGRSMEAEARTILLDALEPTRSQDLSWIDHLICAGNDVGGVDLPVLDDE